MARRVRRPRAAFAFAIAFLPSAEPLLVDGRRDPGEWRLAAAERPAAGEVLVRREPGAVWILVRSDVEMPVHFYRVEAGTLTVLHASASLGAAVYRPAADGGLELASPFDWRLRDPRLRETPTLDLGGEQRQFLAHERWVASTTWLGEPGVVELRLDRAWLEAPGVRWAVTYFAGGDEARHLVHYPPGSGLADPEVERQLMIGDCPRRVVLGTGAWKSSPDDSPQP